MDIRHSLQSVPLRRQTKWKVQLRFALCKGVECRRNLSLSLCTLLTDVGFGLLFSWDLRFVIRIIVRNRQTSVVWVQVCCSSEAAPGCGAFTAENVCEAVLVMCYLAKDHQRAEESSGGLMMQHFTSSPLGNGWRVAG